VAWVTDTLGPGSRLLAARRLRPGGWHVNHAVDILCADGGVRRLVLRRWARPGWEADDPDYTVDREVRVLGLLIATPVPAPQVVAADPAGSRCDVPAILLTRLPGHPPRRADAEAEGFGRLLAQTLALIHAVGDQPPHRAQSAVVPYRLYYDRARAEPARWMSGSRTWARVVAEVREAPPPAVATLIHRDYHPENTLWSRRRLTGVVDWTQASWGPPELDVAHMRWNLAADHGQQLADQFLACYRAITGRALEYQPYWDLVSLLDLLLDGDPDDPGDLGPDDRRNFEAYAEAALSRFQPR
jgi:aminoglycoside phosphotransferase (APT) family kinase protein